MGQVDRAGHVVKGFGRAALLLLALLCPWAASAQGAADATFRVVVVDPSGAVIVGAHVTMTPTAPGAAAQSLDTGPDGEARLTSLVPGRYTIRVESPGFETATVREARVSRGDNRREVKLAIARLAETVDVGRDPRERGADPRSDALATVLGPDAINELPDDPDEMERILNDMAGPGAVMRVNGFRGGKLPPKDQIAQIRFHRNMFAADTHEPGFMSIDIITKPGLENWRGATNIGVRDAALNARNPFAPEKGDEHFRRLAFSLSGPLWKKRTSLSLSAETVDAFDSKTIVAALPTGYFA
ncbi:MAG TPA: carboxypeptidase-like regulatory domain-containing protein, partial [Vicinamibacterales bacterium]